MLLIKDDAYLTCYLFTYAKDMDRICAWCIWIQAPYSVIQVHGVQNCAESVHQNGGQKSNADIRASFSLRFDYTLTKHLKTFFSIHSLNSL
jgi:hypothetical protein